MPRRRVYTSHRSQITSHFFAPSHPQPQSNLRRCRTRCIEQGIPRRSGPAGNERLMKFVQCRISRRDEERPNRPSKFPSVIVPAHAAHKEKTEYEIFGKVRRLADEEMHSIQRFRAGRRKQPVERRDDKAGRVAGGKCVGGRIGNQDGPQDSRHPRTQAARKSAECLPHYSTW
jgi:hypothetical protein